jgi:PAS domain S-box-containing protein
VTVDSARDRAERLEAIFEHSPLPRIECDSRGDVIMCNPAAERLFGMRHTQLAGRPLSSLLALTEAELRALAEHPRVETIDAEAHAHGGHRVNCTASITPFPAVSGRRAGFDVVLSGIRETVA